MSAMFSIFGKKRDAGGPAVGAGATSARPKMDMQAQIKSVTEQQEMLTKAMTAAENQRREALSNALQYRNRGDKKMALMQLKRAKQLEARGTKYMTMHDNLNALLTAMTDVKLNVEFMKVAGDAATVLNTEVERIGGADAVDDIRGKVDDALGMADEIDRAVGESWVRDDGVSDADLEAELAALGTEDLTATLVAPGATGVPSAAAAAGVAAGGAGVAAAATAPVPLPYMPAVPTTAAGPVAVGAGGGRGGGTSVEDELAALEAGM